jgi:hypothetical protein
MTTGWTGFPPQPGDIILLCGTAPVGSLPTWSISGSTFAAVPSTAGMTDIPASQGDGSGQIFYRICDGTETTLTIGIGSSQLYTVSARAYSGRSTTTPFLVTPITEGPGGEVVTPCTLSTIATGITGNSGDDIVFFGMIGALNSTSDTVTFTAPTGFGNSVLETNSAVEFLLPIASCDYVNYPGGATGNLTGGHFNWTGGGEKGWGGYLISLNAAPPAANYTFVNQLDYSTTSGALTISSNGSGGPNNTIALTVGNFLIAGFFNSTTSTPGGSMSDSLGNTYIPSGYIVGSAGETVQIFAGVVTTAGNAVVTATGTNANIAMMFVDQYAPTTGYAISTSPAVIQGNYQNGGGTGANFNVAPAAPIAIPAGIYLLYGFNYQAGGTVVNTAGTSPIAFTGRGAMWEVANGTIGPGLAEDALITSTGGTYSVTFGTTTIRQNWSILAAFQIGLASVPGGPTPRCLYIMP